MLLEKLRLHVATRLTSCRILQIPRRDEVGILAILVVALAALLSLRESSFPHAGLSLLLLWVHLVHRRLSLWAHGVLLSWLRTWVVVAKLLLVWWVVLLVVPLPHVLLSSRIILIHHSSRSVSILPWNAMLHLLGWIHSLATSVHAEVASVAWLASWSKLTIWWPTLVVAGVHHGVALVIVVIILLGHPWLAYLPALAVHASLAIVVAYWSTATIIRVLILRSTLTTHELAAGASRAPHLTCILALLLRVDKACRWWLTSVSVVTRCAALSCVVELDWACQNELALHFCDRCHRLLMGAEAEEAVALRSAGLHVNDYFSFID